MTAGILLAGGTLATADEHSTDAAPAKAPAADQTSATATVEIPVAQVKAQASTLAPAASSITVEAPESDNGRDSDESASETRDRDERASRNGERRDRDRDSQLQERKASAQDREEGESSLRATGKGARILAAARSGIGTRYVWGGSSYSGFDCSGLVRYAYRQAGISLPRSSGGIASAGKRISRSEARPGDVVVWPGHVGIYAGNGRVVDASDSKRVVVERSLWGSPRFVTFR